MTVPDAEHRGPLAVQRRARHNAAVSKSITIRDVPDATSEELASRAALTGRSLQEYVRARLIDIADSPDAEVWMARVRARKVATGTSIGTSRVLTHRDADRT